MISTTLNTTATTANALITLPSMASVSKKANLTKSYLSYTFQPKNVSRKSAARISAIDWDLNRNELEFE